MGFQNSKEGDYYSAEKAGKNSVPSVRKVEHHTEPSKRMEKKHLPLLGIQLYKGEQSGAWRMLTVRPVWLQLLMVTVQYSQKDHYCLIPERSN